MEWITRLMGESCAGSAFPYELPPSCFYCLLGEQPTHLVAERWLAKGQNEVVGEFIVNPHCVFCHDHELPAEVAEYAELLEQFALYGDVVWLRDPGTEVLAPFWLGPQFASLLAAVGPGDPAPPNLSRHAKQVLVQAGVLVKKDAASRRRKQWLQEALRHREDFRRKFVTVAGLIHPFQVAALRRYYRYLIRNGRIQLGDDQSPLRYGAHNEPVARFFHHQLTTAVTDIVGEPVKPSYVYSCSYLAGSDLEKHTDRVQCEFTITFCLDFSPEPASHTPWPIHVETPEGKVTVYQAPGDSLLFCGRELPHYRYPLQKGCTSTSIFFHYVRQGFTGSLQ
ncbi:MAG TPA: hypothetical protein VFJ47_05560 [Terriglobales bacterium]|nr:hypothetical protein [Terriglobales bacterium]